MRHFYFFLMFIGAGFNLEAQKHPPLIDTVLPGYYIAPDTSYRAFMITLHNVGAVTVDRQVEGHEIPADVLLMIAFLDSGSTVTFSHISILKANRTDTLPSWSFFVGNKNSTKARNARGDTTYISAGKLAAIHLDSNVLAFAVNYPTLTGRATFGVPGNKIPVHNRPAIEAIPSGQMVYFEMLLIDDGGSRWHRVPLRCFMIVN